MYFKRITEPRLAHNAYLIGCRETGQAIIVDPLRDIDRYLRIAGENDLAIVAATETHIHADYLSGLRQFAERENTTVYASDEGDADWKYEWLSGSEYRYQLVVDGDNIKIGNIILTVQKSPGHTPEHVSFVLADHTRTTSRPRGILTGDFVFVGDVGRPDLLESAAGQVGSMVPSAGVLYDSLQLFKKLSPDLMLWPGHGAGSACGRSLGAAPVSTVGYEQRTNPSVRAAGDKKEFIEYILDGQPEPPPYFARMKQLNRDGQPVLKDYPRPNHVDTREIGQLLKAPDTLFIDARPWEAFREGHLPRSLFIPPESAVSTLIGSYVQPEMSLCFIVDPSDLDEMVRHCIRVGVDKVEGYIEPGQISEYANSGGELVSCDEISMNHLADKLNLPDTMVLDVRRAAELPQVGWIEGAFNIAHAQLLTRHKELPVERNMHIYCQNGNRSRYAAAFLQSKGYVVTHVAGGIADWIQLRQPLAHSA